MLRGNWLEGVLGHLQIPFEIQEVTGFSPATVSANGEIVANRMIRTVVLADRGRPLVVVLRQSDRLDLARVQAIAGEEDVRFATDAEIAEWFHGARPGAVPPLPVRGDVVLLMDRGVACLNTIGFAAGDAETIVSVRFRDWYRAVRPGVGRFAAVSHVQPEQNSANILVVEDEADTNELLCRLLEKQGISCRGAEHGQGALDLAHQAAPSAILLDLMLPDMSGFDVYERLRKHGPIKRIPTIVVTALDDDASRQRSEELGADAYLTKPFLPEQLLAEVEEVLADAKG